MSDTVKKNLGIVTAYGYARSKGYEGTEEEFAELMASYAEVAEDAAQSASEAAQSATNAAGSATAASGSAVSAANSATSASGSAQDAETAQAAAQQSATAAAGSATSASGSATAASGSAAQAAQSATSAAGSATSAQSYSSTAASAAQAASGSADDADTSATAAAASAASAAESARTLTIDDTLTQQGQAADSKKTGDEISAIKADLNQIETTSSINLYDAIDVTGFVQNDGSIATNGSWANYSTGTIKLSAGTYTIYGYTPEYNLSGSRFGIAVINGTAVESYVNEYPSGSKKTITITGNRTVMISATSDVKKMVVSGSEIISPYQEYEPVITLETTLTKKIDNNILSVDLEIGNINLNVDDGPTFDNDYRRVRTKTPLNLVSGDVIGLTDYTNAEIFIMWQNTLGGYGHEVNWVDYDYRVRFSGKYWLIIRNKTEVRQTKISTLGNMLVIRRNQNQFGAVINKTMFCKGVNHRGFAPNKFFPENTLIAFKASKAYGFNYVEADVTFTSDNVAVILHDATINRTARNSDGTEISSLIDIGSITYEQALTYDFGVYAQSAYAGTKIPTFTQFIALCKNLELIPVIELKDNNGVQYSDALITGLVDIVAGYGMQNNVIWSSYNINYLELIETYDSKATLCLISNTISSTTISLVSPLKNSTNTVYILSGSYTAEEVALCEAANIYLGVFTINTHAGLDALPTYVTMVVSDLYNASEYFYNHNVL